MVETASSSLCSAVIQENRRPFPPWKIHTICSSNLSNLSFRPELQFIAKPEWTRSRLSTSLLLASLLVALLTGHVDIYIYSNLVKRQTCQAGSLRAVSSQRLGPKYWRSLHRKILSRSGSADPRSRSVLRSLDLKFRCC